MLYYIYIYNYIYIYIIHYSTIQHLERDFECKMISSTVASVMKLDVICVIAQRGCGFVLTKTKATSNWILINFTWPGLWRAIHLWMCLWIHVFIGQDRGVAMVPFDFRHIEPDLLEEDDGSTSLMNKKIFEILAVEWQQIQTSSDHIYPEPHRWSPNSSRSEQCKDSWILNPQHIKTAHAMSRLHYLLVPIVGNGGIIQPHNY